MTNKKKSLSNARTLDKLINIGPNGPVNYTPAFKLPSYARAACHLHEKPVFFKTIEDMGEHNQKMHDYRKMK